MKLKTTLRASAAAAAAAALCIAATPALAGPPYVTDDPEPTDPGHWEVFSYVSGTHTSEATEGDFGFDINYGLAKDLQLTVVVPVGFAHERDLHTGFGDIELGLKYRLLHQDDGGALPDLSFFPAVSLPTGSGEFGAKRASFFLPLWAQKDYGEWSVFGGGGYEINPGPGNKNFWLTGLAVTKQWTERLNVGAEVYHQTADADDAPAVTGVNLGVDIGLTERFSLLASAGPVFHEGRSGDYAFYTSLLAEF